MRVFVSSLLATGLALAIASDAAAQPQVPPPPPHDTFVATVVSVGRPPGFLCGGMMALQPLEVQVAQVSAGSLHAGDKLTVKVLACFQGPLLVPITAGTQAPVQLDPAVVKPGVRIAFDMENKAVQHLAFTTEMRVVP